MHKLYIVLTQSIINIGGAEIYARNKYSYLRNAGWDCLVVSTRQGNIVIDDLKRFKTSIIKELRFGPYLYSPSQRKKLMKTLVSILPDTTIYDEVIVESHSLTLSLWGEMLSKEISAKHLAFLLEEHCDLDTQKYDFLKFKHNRGELAGINRQSLKLLFRPYGELPDDKSYYLLAHCTNSVEEIPDSKWDKIPDAQYNIGSIGRLEKPYLQSVIKDITEFVDEHPDSTFNIFFIGGETNGSAITNQIYSIFFNHRNVKVYITGFIYPIPLSLINRIDVFMSSAGSVRVSENAGRFTIAYDSNDLQPIGLYGYTTDNSLFRDSEPKTTGKEWLDKILIEKAFTPKSKPFVPFRPSFDAHMEFLDKGDGHPAYYDFPKWKLNMKDMARSMIIRLIGPSNYIKYIDFKANKAIR